MAPLLSRSFFLLLVLGAGILLVLFLLFSASQSPSGILSEARYQEYYASLSSASDDTLEIPVQVSIAGFSPSSYELKVGTGTKKVLLRFYNPDEFPHTVSRPFSEEELSEFRQMGLDPSLMRREFTVQPRQTLEKELLAVLPSPAPVEISYSCTQNCVQEPVPEFVLKLLP